MTNKSPLYLGFDLSTQQLKVIAITSDLKVTYEAVFDFDADAAAFGIKKGVLTNEAEREVYAPVQMWLQAIDSVLQKLQNKGIDFERVRGISGAGQQHGSVYWSLDAENTLRNLHEGRSLEAQLHHAFSFPYSPNWQDSSTQMECDTFDEHLGDDVQLALCTGSKAHHRFTGPQILRFRHQHPDAYAKTSRISLVSSFLASIFLGRIAPIDIADVCGMNLFDIKAGSYNQELLALAGGSSDLESKLGQVAEDGGSSFGSISPYFVRRYGFKEFCTIAPFTGDNPSTILALPLRPLDAMISLGTSTTFLTTVPHYKPDPAVHFMNHPTTPGLYLFMLCYKNGGLAREQIRDSLPPNPPRSPDRWAAFNYHAIRTRPLGASTESSPAKIALYFPRPEIVPNVQAGMYRYTFDGHQSRLSSPSEWKLPEDDCRAIIESQLLSLRLRSREILAHPTQNPQNVPTQPRRIYLVGGGSQNTAIAKLAGEILGGIEGVYRLDVGGNACALGSAYKAVWAVERKPKETFEDLIGKRWREEEFIEKIGDGYEEAQYRIYEKGVSGLEAVEKDVLTRQAIDVGKASTTGAEQV